MARRLDASGFAHDTVLASGVYARVAWKPRIRFRLTDLDGGDLGLDPQVTDTVIGFERSRIINGSLSIEMEPLPALLREAFQVIWWPEVGLGPMPNSGTAWLPMGAYVWTAPNRVVKRIGLRGAGQNVERWMIGMGDLNFLLGKNGPGRTGFTAHQDARGDDEIRHMLTRAGVADHSGVEHSDDRLSESLHWTLAQGPRASRQMRQDEWARVQRAYQSALKKYKAAKKAKKKKIPEKPEKPKRTLWRDQDERGNRWMHVAAVLHEVIGYHPPHRDLNGVYVARPAEDPSSAVPEIHLRTDRRSIITEDIGIEPDLAGIANEIHVVAQEAKDKNPGTVVAVARLADLLPSHPLAPQNCHVEIYDEVHPSTAMTQGAANALARAELTDSLVAWERLTVETAFDPRHVGFEIPTLTVDDDPEFTTAQVCVEESWEYQQSRGTMSLELSRAYRDFIA